VKEFVRPETEVDEHVLVNVASARDRGGGGGEGTLEREQVDAQFGLSRTRG